MRITDDPIRDAEAWIAEQEQGLPRCDSCGEPIYEDYYFDIMGDHVCQKCIDEMKREVSYEDYD